MTSTYYRLPGRLPTPPRPRRPLILQLLRPLGVPALIVLVLTLWPLFQFLWLFGLLVVMPSWFMVRALRQPRGEATSTTRPAPPAWAAAPAPRPPANAIIRPAGRLPRR